MDFARKQLEKYGWTDGKGLGRHEDGISEALKPKIKRSVAGIGHDAASEKVKESESESEEEKKDVFKMTDEELFKACEGRTAHKGARHGLKATGKLARIAQQEALLLTEPRFSGYSHAKKLTKDKVVEESNCEVPKSKKKKKRKHCQSNEKLEENSLSETDEKPLPDNHDVTQHINVIGASIEVRVDKKSKGHEVEEEENVDIVKPKKSKKERNDSKVKHKKK